MQRVAFWACALVGTVSCSGATTDRRDNGAAGTTGDQPTAGTGATPGGAGKNSIGGSGSTAGAASHAGAATAGQGGAASAGSAGAASAGAGGHVFIGEVAGLPATGAGWEVPTGDPLNSTPPVLARLGTGVVVAGASADPKTVGVDAFATGVKSEAFLAGLDHAGKAQWRRPLLAAGLPNAVAVNAAQEIVVLAAYLPDLETVSPFFSSDSIYLGKFMANGTPIFEKELKFDSGTRLYALGLGAGGSIWAAGAQTGEFPNESVALAKYDASGAQQFFKLFPCDGSCYVTDLTVTASGDVLFCGSFNSTFDLGGGPLTTQAKVDAWPSYNGFVARFDGTGKHVWSQRFGGPIFDLGVAIAALPDEDSVLSGKLSGAASIGGKSVTAEAEEGQAFVARLDPDGKARWVELADGSARANTLEVDGDMLHVAGNFDTTAYLQDRELATGKLLGATKALTGTPYASAAALDSTGSLWLAGSYAGALDLGNQNALSAASGVFLLRLDRAP
jgi:hypothetical protein